MSRSGKISFRCLDGEMHTFRLAIGQLVELQEKCDAGPAWIVERLQSGRWLLADIRDTIRLGLIGGGMKPVEAGALISRYVDNVDEHPLLENRQTAVAILMAALVGAEDEPPGKPAAEGAPNSSAESSPSPPFTATAASSA